MNIIIDELDDLTDFVAYNNASLVIPENNILEFVAGPINTSSVQFNFLQNGDFVEKILDTPIDVTNYNYAICHFYSSFNKLKKGVYSISFDNNIFFKIDTYNYISDQYFVLKDITNIDRIKIVYNGNIEDNLICSHCLAVYDELPLDIFKAIKNQLDNDFDKILGKGFILGTVNTRIGQDQISLKNIAYTNLKYIDRYSHIIIDDGVNTEKHIIENNNENYFRLGKLYDGETIKNNFTDANIYLSIPVRYGIKDKEYNVPSISITGFDPNAILRGNKEETIKSSFTNNDSYIRLDDQIYEYFIQIACIDRAESDIMSFMSKIIRDFISREKLWINGQKYYIIFDGKPEFIELIELDNPIAGLVYTIKLEIKEEIWENKKIINSQPIKLGVVIKK